MRSKTLLLIAATVALLGAQGCNRHDDDSGKVRGEIDARNKELGAAFAKGDAAGVAAMYSSSAQAFPPNGPTLSGHEAIQKAWQGFVDAGFKGIELTSTEVEAYGDHADEEGTYRVIGKDGQTADVGKYIVIWKKENNQWVLHRDIWNSNNPPPAPPPPAAAPEAAAPPGGAEAGA